MAGHVSNDEQFDVCKFKIKNRFSRQQINISCLVVSKVIQGSLPRAEFHGELTRKVHDMISELEVELLARSRSS